MANAAALINEGLWRKDKEFQKVSRMAQCTFCQVLACKDLDTAGVLTLHLELLAKGCHELTVEQLKADLAELEAGRFLFVDYDTDELFIRSYVRNVSVKNKNSWFSVPKNSLLVASPKIRHELATELRRLRRKDADDVADAIDPLPTTSPPRPDGVGTPSTPGTPSEPRRDGDSQVQVLVLESPSVVNSVGEQRPHCPNHPTNSEDEDCRRCWKRRLWDETHEAEMKADQVRQQREKKNLAAQRLKDCPECDEDGWRRDDYSVKCRAHQEVS